MGKLLKRMAGHSVLPSLGYSAFDEVNSGYALFIRVCFRQALKRLLTFRQVSSPDCFRIFSLQQRLCVVCTDR